MEACRSDHPHRSRFPAVHSRWAIRDPFLFFSLYAEFIGSGLFQLAGRFSNDPLVTAVSLSASMYATKYISGGHINPAVSLAATLFGHIDYVRGFSYILAQFLSAIGGALLQAWLSPDSAMGVAGPGCFSPIKELSDWCVFGWETVLTFLIISVMYASTFVRPGHGDYAPLATGTATFAALATGGRYTGLSLLNPARGFADSLVFRCVWRWALVYTAGELTALLLAAGWALLVFGKGKFYQRWGWDVPLFTFGFALFATTSSYHLRM